MTDDNCKDDENTPIVETLVDLRRSGRYSWDISATSRAVVTIFLALAAAIITTACQSATNLTPTPTPPSVVEVYRTFEAESNSNVARLMTREENREHFRFRGSITRIGDKEIRFYVEPPMTFAEDLYVECNFESNQQIASLNLGDEVSVRGELARAFRGRLFGIGETRAVIFEECKIEDAV